MRISGFKLQDVIYFVDYEIFILNPAFLLCFFQSLQSQFFNSLT